MSQPAPDRPFSLPLPFDPLRLLFGVREKWWLMLLLPLVLGGIGFYAGSMLSENRFSVSLQLLKTDVPGTFQITTTGESFRPRELSNETLLATTYATEVLRGVGDRVDPPAAASEVKNMLEIARDNGTDFFYLTAHSNRSPEHSIALVKAWAQEIMSFTQDVQRQEALRMHQFLTTQIRQLREQIDSLNQEILQFTREEKFVDENLQVESALAALEDLRLQRELAQVNLQAKEMQIANYSREIKGQSPVIDQLKKKREELTFLRGRYTDENPLVKEKLYEIEFLENQLEDGAEQTAGESEDPAPERLDAYTGSDLGNQIYLEILALEAERIELENRLNQLNGLIEEREADLQNLPAKQLALARMKNEQTGLMKAVELLSSRQKETEFFMTNAPGYWTVFQEPSLKEVSASTRRSKLAMLTLGGLLAGLATAMLVAFIWEIAQPGLRTPLQTAAVAATQLRLSYFTGYEKSRSLIPGKAASERYEQENQERLHEFWLTELAADKAPFPSILFIADRAIAGEEHFWNDLIRRIREEERNVIVLQPTFAGDDAEDVFSRIHLPEIAPASLKAGHSGKLRLSNAALTSFPQQQKEISTQSVLLTRMEGLPGAQLRALLKAHPAYYFLCDPAQSRRREAGYLFSIYRRMLSDANGLILLTPYSNRALFRMLYYLEDQFFQWLRDRPAKSADNEQPHIPGKEAEHDLL